jgi:hypothetical protein
MLLLLLTLQYQDMVLMNLEHTWLESTHFNHQQINQSQFIQQLAKSFQL